MATIHTALENLVERLGKHSESPRLDAQVLLGHVLGRPRSWILAHPEAEIQAGPAQALEAAARRLEAGTPLPYVLGRWEFYGLSLSVTPDVLIPRPETELLVEQALAWLKDQPGSCLGVDVGTGSGCIVAAIAAHALHTRWIASDISYPALQVARENLAAYHLPERVDLIQSDLLPPVTRPFNIICANLPYIGEAEVKKLPIYGREPSLALTPGPEGIALIQRLLQAAPLRLAPGGLVLLEIEASQGPAALALAAEAFPLAEIRLLPDLAGHDRLLRISQKNPY